ncbi:hypothetical protein EWI07_08680 [Sporolactobacillus sp. THM7-4]|nr:hypothetical protein EWI07_08680 [Sporolactobacillus sp. THM7-4]
MNMSLIAFFPVQPVYRTDCELDTVKAYRMKLTLQEIYRYPRVIAEMGLKDWIQWGLRCRLEPMEEVAKMLKTIIKESSSGLNQT